MDHLILGRIKGDRLFEIPAARLLVDDANVEVFETPTLGALGQLAHSQHHAFDDLLTLDFEVLRFRNRL